MGYKKKIILNTALIFFWFINQEKNILDFKILFLFT